MVEKGYLKEGELDRAVYELFLERFRTGEFDADGGSYRKITSNVIETDEHVAKSEEVAEETLVLLQNKNNFLPLKIENSGNVTNKTKDNNALYTIKETSVNENRTIDVDLEYNGSSPASEATMISIVKDASGEKIKNIVVKEVSGSGKYEIESGANDNDDVNICIWNSLLGMKPLMPSYRVNKSAKNYNVVVVGNFADALLL